MSTVGKSNNSGFTFVELIVLLAVIGVVCAAVLPRISILGDGDLDRSTRRIIAGVRDTRIRAQLDGVPWHLCILPAANRDVAKVNRAEHRITIFDDIVTSVVLLPDGKTVSGAAACLSFTPDGLADAAYIHLASGPTQRTVHVKPFNPKPGVYEGHVM